MSEMTVKQYKEDFHEELKALLQKYKVDISLEDFGYDHMPDMAIVAEFDFHEELGIISNINYGSNIGQ